MTSAFGRRTLLGGVGAAALLFPYGRSLRTRAQAQGAPKRLLVWFTPNGTLYDDWLSSSSGNELDLGAILQPLSEHKDELLILDSLDIDPQGGPGDAHQKGMGCVLTGRQLLPGDLAGGCETCAPVSWAGGISIDQLIAREVAGLTRSSIEFGLSCGNDANIWSRMCYSAAGIPLPPEQDPFDHYDRLFGGAELDPEEAQKRKALRKSVLDYLQEDLSALKKNLSAEDKLTFDVHTESLRELEKRLDSGLGTGAACDPVAPGNAVNLYQAENYPVLAKHQMDLIAMAFACDMTRVASMQWNRSVGDQTFPFIDVSGGHHSLSHEANSSSQARTDIVKINTWYAEQLAYLMSKLKAMPEGDGTVMDNTVIVWINELSDGETHSRKGLPVLVAGSAGGYFKTGQRLSFVDTPLNNLWVSVANAMGVDITTFGDPKHCDGPLSGIRA